MKYIVPKTKTVRCSNSAILSSSNFRGGHCNDTCKLWHCCHDRDRLEGRLCKDKK